MPTLLPPQPVKVRLTMTDREAVPPACGIAIMAKASAPGRTKTRLVPPLSFDEAAAFNTAFLQDILRNIETAGREAPISGYLAYGPAGSEPFFQEALSPEVQCFESAFPTFGACLSHAIAQLFARGHTAAVVLNSDSPTLPPGLLVDMAALLDEPGDRAVLGPSTDGGYYLLGLKAMHFNLFEAIDWSTDRVAEQTRARAEEVGLAVEVLPTWYDVDDAAALRTLYGELFQDQPFETGGRPSGHAPRTRQLFQDLILNSNLALRLGLEPLTPAEPLPSSSSPSSPAAAVGDRSPLWS